MSITPGKNPVVSIPTEGDHYRIREAFGGRYIVYFFVGDLEVLVKDDQGLPMTFATAESANRWVCL